MKLEPVAWTHESYLPPTAHSFAGVKNRHPSFPVALYAIPEGYVVVPVEISGKMWSAGRDALRKVIDAYEEAQGYELRSGILDRGPEKIHEAMIAAKEQS